MICPKCQYERIPNDDAPAWQCPSCKVAYAKVTQVHQTKPTHEVNKQFDSNNEASEVAINLFELIVVIAIVLATIPWMMYSMNTLLPAMGVERIKIKALILLGLAPSAVLISVFLKLRPMRGGELSVIRKTVFLIVILLMWVTIKSCTKTEVDVTKTEVDDTNRSQAYWDSQTELIEKICHGGQLDGEALNEAMEEGYKVNGALRCITKESYANLQEETKQVKAQQAIDTAEYDKLHAAEDARVKQTQALQQEEQIRYAQAKEARKQNEQNKLPRLPEGYFYRCTATDGTGFNNLNRETCPAGYKQSVEETGKPVIPRSPNNQGPIKCTSKDGNVSIQMGNCASPEDYKQAI